MRQCATDEEIMEQEVIQPKRIFWQIEMCNYACANAARPAAIRSYVLVPQVARKSRIVASEEPVRYCNMPGPLEQWIAIIADPSSMECWRDRD